MMQGLHGFSIAAFMSAARQGSLSDLAVQHPFLLEVLEEGHEPHCPSHHPQLLLVRSHRDSC